MIVSNMIFDKFKINLLFLVFQQQNLNIKDSSLLLNVFSGVLEPRCPVYSFTDYARMRSRPKKSSKIYSALRGPNANEAQVFITQNNEGEPIKTCNLQWFDDEPLFLYAGRRFCIEKESNSRGLLSSLFKSRRDRSGRFSLFARKENKRHPEFVGVNELICEQLMRLCGTVGQNIPVAKLSKGIFV